MNGIHDLGGMHGFGPVEPHADAGPEPFAQPWHGRVFAMALLTTGAGVFTTDSFRSGIESMAPVEYLSAGYYGRWLAALESRLVAAGATSTEEVETRCSALARGAEVSGAEPYRPPDAGTFRVDAKREPNGPPAFAVGQSVRARNLNPAGHTRLPRYVRGKLGIVLTLGGRWVFPDTNADGRGENPCHVYCVRFDGSELWGPDAEPGTSVSIDLFEPYLEAA